MDLQIKDKVAVVTAASQGLGKAVAEALAAEGVRLAICSRNQQRIEKTAGFLKTTYGIQVLPVVCDVTDTEDITLFKEKVIEHFQTCHILFTNAGGPPPGRVGDVDAAAFKKAIELNLMSTINLVSTFLPIMKEQKWGRIIASTSISVKQPIPTLALSNVSRVGVVAYIKTLSTETASMNVTANVLAPGYIMTDRVRELLEVQAQKDDISYNQALEDLSRSIPVNSIGSPSDFGALAAFLASEQASYITGETILMDGGMYKGLM